MSWLFSKTSGTTCCTITKTTRSLSKVPWPTWRRRWCNSQSWNRSPTATILASTSCFPTPSTPKRYRITRCLFTYFKPFVIRSWIQWDHHQPLMIDGEENPRRPRVPCQGTVLRRPLHQWGGTTSGMKSMSISGLCFLWLVYFLGMIQWRQSQWTRDIRHPCQTCQFQLVCLWTWRTCHPDSTIRLDKKLDPRKLVTTGDTG